MTSADAWAMAEAIGKEAARALGGGDYFARWTDDEQPAETVVSEVRRALRERGLTLETDDEGLRVVPTPKL